MSTGSFGISMRNGLKIETATMAAIATSTAPGTATRKIRTIRLCRAATAEARLQAGVKGGVVERSSHALQQPNWTPDKPPE